jgi:beta-glucuronidase
MVEEYKNEPYVLMWVLGNENNYSSVSNGETPGSGCLAQQQPEAYYSFVNECAKLIKSLDPHKRPVAICNGDAYMLDYCAKYAPDIDVYGANVYRGDYGMGQIWSDIAREYGKPVLITEYGCPGYAKGWSTARIEQGQALYHKNNWNDIMNNTAGIQGGAGNSLGGVVFEWVDEWWKSGYTRDANDHDTVSQWAGPFLDGFAYEEWFGITSQGGGRHSPFERQLRKAYFTYRQLWNNN